MVIIGHSRLRASHTVCELIDQLNFICIWICQQTNVYQRHSRAMVIIGHSRVRASHTVCKHLSQTEQKRWPIFIFQSFMKHDIYIKNTIPDNISDNSQLFACVETNNEYILAFMPPNEKTKLNLSLHVCLLQAVMGKAF